MAKSDGVATNSEFIKKTVRQMMGAFSPYVQATFVAAETTDSNLSQVTVQGATTRYVRKLSSVGTMTAGQQLLCLQGWGIPLTIIGVVVGDISKTG